MRRKERFDTPSQTSRARFQTPDKAATTVPSTNTSRPSQKTASSKKEQTPATSSHTGLKHSRERDCAFGSVNQPTLTQIDWAAIKRQGPDLDDAGLDYIDTAADGPRDDAPDNNVRHEVIDIPDGSDGDVDYCPAPSSRTRLPRGPGTKKRNASEQRKSSATPTNANAEKNRSRRKSGVAASSNNKANKQPGRGRDNTLTQMNYVRRYVKIEPDEDVQLEYTYYSPEKDKNPESREAHLRSAQEALEPTKQEPVDLSAHKRRKLSGPGESPDHKDTHSNYQPPQMCLTPKKSVKTEIPSSQSPESPGFAVVSPSRFGGMNRLSLKQTCPDTDDRPIKEEPLGISQREKRSYDASSPSNAVLERPSPPSSPLPYNSHTSSGPKKTSATSHEDARDVKPEKIPSGTQRTVVYETDAESDGSDFLDDASQVSAKDQANDDGDDDYNNSIEGSQNSSHDKSQELPRPIIASDRDNESEQRFIEATLSSDASICYGRPQQSTQFPLEPIPPLNTQKMTELFPSYKESNGQQIMAETTQTQSSPILQRRSLPIYPQNTQTQTQTQNYSQAQSQSQPQSNNPDKRPTDIVPESSPVARQDDGVDSNSSKPHDTCGQESVVQVESSQPPDKLLMNFRTDQDSGPRGFISGNQLLSSSVMESIPMPQLWMGSQDSIGEPYSEVDQE